MALERAIGIDLGTTFSCAAIVEGGKPQVIRSRLGYTTVPSIVTFDDQGNIVVGQPAARRMILQPEECIYGSKRLIGRAFLRSTCERFQEHFQYKLVPDSEGFVAAQIGGRTVPLVDAAAVILKDIHHAAEEGLGLSVSKVVITVPAYFNENQRALVREAGKKAGLEVIRLLSEPTSAALCFGFNREERKRLLVFDLGGGTFDVSIVKLEGNVFTVEAVDGDNFLGGLDFDRRLAEFIAERLESRFRAPLDLSPVDISRLRLAAQEAKHQLSVQQQSIVQIPALPIGNGQITDVAEKISRQEFEESVSELITKIMSIVKRSLDRLKLRPSDIDDVLLVGGQTRMPIIHKALKDLFGKEPNKRVHPDEAVALGAAIVADSHTRLDMTTLHDVVAMPIGIAGADGRLLPVVPRNAPVPFEAKAEATIPARSTSLKLAIFQGERTHAYDNEYLGSLLLEDLKPMDKPLQCQLAFKLDEESLLKIQATIPALSFDREMSLATQQTPDEILMTMGKERIQVVVPQSATAQAARPARSRPVSTLSRVTLSQPKAPAAEPLATREKPPSRTRTPPPSSKMRTYIGSAKKADAEDESKGWWGRLVDRFRR